MSANPSAIGTRRLQFNRATATRGFEKLWHWLAPAASFSLSEPKPAVVNPKMWPSFRSRLGRALNRRWLARAVGPIAETGPEPVIITTLPVVADLVGRIRSARWVYYCVDDYSVWPGLDGETLQALEAELAAKVDVTVAVSEVLQKHLAKLGQPAHLLEHGVDLDVWRMPELASLPASLRKLNSLPRPLIVYWGVIDRRMDVAFLRRLSELMTEGTILLVGPQDAPDPELLQLPRVRTLAPVPFADLPSLAARAAVLIAPYADLAVTWAMQPLKLKEYLATGQPVVVRKLPSTKAWADCCDAVETSEEFAAAVLLRIKDGLPITQYRARQRLEHDSWSSKAAQFEKWVDGL
jgi:hypothetical protein